jgi:hypothetical protein
VIVLPVFCWVKVPVVVSLVLAVPLAPVLLIRSVCVCR